jgi:NADH:ubiquinone oxidoreductase subunit 6 (subunit J)
MKTFSKFAGIFFWLLGFVLIVYIMREVLSKTLGYTSLALLLGPFIFHAVCMFAGGFFFKKGVQKAPVSPATG